MFLRQVLAGGQPEVGSRPKLRVELGRPPHARASPTIPKIPNLLVPGPVFGISWVLEAALTGNLSSNTIVLDRNPQIRPSRPLNQKRLLQCPSNLVAMGYYMDKEVCYKLVHCLL